MNSTLQRIRVDGCAADGEPEDMFDSSGGRIRQMAVDRRGKRIAYSTIATSSNIWSMRLTAAGVGDPEPLTSAAHTRTVYPTFSPDGRKIAFQKFSTGNISHIWLMNSDGTDEIQIGSLFGVCPSWSRDGSRIWFVSPSGSVTSMWYMTPEGSSEKKMFDFGEEVFIARPSPDGRWIAFQSKQTGTSNVFIRAVDGGETKQLTFDEEFAGFPSWSPDGRWLAVQLKRGEDSFVAFISADGGTITQLTNEKGQSWVSDWSPDGSEILFAGQRDGLWNLYSVSRVTAKQRKLTNFSKLNSYVRYPVWSPVNDRIAFEYAETTGNIWMVDLE
jgi:Tol biopolymer transport system component